VVVSRYVEKPLLIQGPMGHVVTKNYADVENPWCPVRKMVYLWWVSKNKRKNDDDSDFMGITTKNVAF
jgi:hypothetical protein